MFVADAQQSDLHDLDGRLTYAASWPLTHVQPIVPVFPTIPILFSLCETGCCTSLWHVTPVQVLLHSRLV